jgi:hypothetical protein
VSFALNRELVDTMLLLEANLDALDERLEVPGAGQIPDATESVHRIHRHLANLLRELNAALEYCVKVNREVAILQAEAAAQLLRMFEALERVEAGGPPEPPARPDSGASAPEP